MSPLEKIPADQLQDEAMRALTLTDLARLKRLEMIVPEAAAPADAARYWKQRALFAALLDVSVRNLRLFRRAAERHDRQL